MKRFSTNYSGLLGLVVLWLTLKTLGKPIAGEEFGRIRNTKSKNSGRSQVMMDRSSHISCCCDCGWHELRSALHEANIGLGIGFALYYKANNSDHHVAFKILIPIKLVCSMEQHSRICIRI